MKVPIRIKLILYFMIIIFITYIPIGAIAYRYAFNTIENNIYESAKKEMV